MTQDEIINEIILYLDGELKGTRGNIHQESYKGDFFKLFEEAYRNGYFDASSHRSLRGDALSGVIVTRWFTGDESEDKKRKELMHRLLPMWDEWRYAWDHYDE